MIKNLNRFIHFKSDSLNFCLNKYHFALNSIQTTTYPYVFGGLKNVNFVQNQTALMTLKQLFDESTLEGFKEAYKFTLYSFAQKDKKSLQNICEPNLLKNLTFKNVELVNPDADIEVICGNSFKAFGANFIRQSSTELKSMKVEENTSFYLNMGLMNPSNPAGMMKYMTGGLPLLMGYEVYFRSAMKLIPEGGKKNEKTTEVHCLQFQVQGKMNVMKYMKLAMSIQAGKASVDYNQAKNILKEMIGDNFEWKIGDIDKALKGNLNIIG